MKELLFRNGLVFLPGGATRCDIAVRQGKIVALGSISQDSAQEVIDATHLHILPGVIDSQVHFREPGLEHKEDLESGTRAATMGGVTSIFEMPNTHPATIDADALQVKLARAKGRTYADHAFFIGAAEENAEHLSQLEQLPGCCGVKIFMGSSTGSLLVPDDALLRKVLKAGHRRVAVHAEDEPRLRERLALAKEGDVLQHPVWRDEETALRATRRVIALAKETGRAVHVLHITSAEEIDLLSANKDVVSFEITPQHLSLAAPDCYQELGSLAQMNPPIRERRHQEALWQAIQNGACDVIGSDHAPHTLEEKARTYPKSPSGMPGVQTLLPLLLDHHAQGRLSLERIVDLTSAGAARLYNIKNKGRIAVGFDADLVLVDMQKKWRISKDWLQSKCGWSPFEGREITGKPVMTVLRGEIMMQDDEVIGPPIGRPVHFWDTDRR